VTAQGDVVGEGLREVGGVGGEGDPLEVLEKEE